MTLRLCIGLIAGLGALAVVGCGDSGSGEPTGSTESTGNTGDTADTETGAPVTEVAFDEFHEAAEAAFCEWQVACRQYGVDARCRAVNHMEARLSMRRLAGVGSEESVPIDYMKQAVEVGRIGYDKKAAATCLAYVRSRTCERPSLHLWTEEELAGQAACEAVFTGRMGRNGPCVSAAECAEESVCGFDPSCTDMCCVGACRVFAVPLAVGEPCSFSGVDCVPEAYCAFDPSLGTPTVCTPLVEAGGDCSFGQTCAETARCDGDRCRTVELRGPGEDCEGDFVECEAPGECRGTGVGGARCVVPPQLGAPCDDQLYCARFDTFCDPNSQLCTLLPGPGQGCGASECVPYAQCRTGVEGAVEGDFAGTCVRKADEGEACGSQDGGYVECRPPFQCLDGDRCALPAFESEQPCPVPDAG